ncbi:hypothetical protein FAZ15_02120 [Sphingobacterium olei]|uniref:Beta-lactamase-inhibitor-like PepSY-like domain-containing protein n=1 Tax=Sphingobacterium olei TaxID=2571155 RepID=A0A4U0P6N7_9SPHI|nr:hypothetical protein [Sphingobacterium olei]TJZ63115.1 hypothetical protein FAZ15_02120 [Sphingobacterium olei]
MFWYKQHKYSVFKAIGILSLASALFSCTSTDTSTKGQVKLFDLPSFFQSEIKRLKKINPTITKTVRKDSISEVKQIKIDNWDTELSSFVSTDINKPAYDGFVDVDSVDNLVTYTVTSPDLDLSCIQILYKNEKVSDVIIERKVKNSLYNTTEFLEYRKDDSYTVEKNQSVIAVGDNYYKIEGKF